MFEFFFISLGILIGYFLRELLILKKGEAKLREIQEEIELKKKILLPKPEKDLLLLLRKQKKKEKGF